HADLRAFLEDVVVVVDVYDEERALLPGEPDPFVVDQAGVLDGVDAGPDRVLDPLRPVRVRGHLAAVRVRLLHDRGQLLRRELRRARLVALREDASGGADLHQVGPVLDDLAHLRPRLPRAVGDARRAVAVLGR